MYIVKDLTLVQCSQPLPYVHCTKSYNSAVQSTFILCTLISYTSAVQSTFILCTLISYTRAVQSTFILCTLISYISAVQATFILCTYYFILVQCNQPLSYVH